MSTLTNVFASHASGTGTVYSGATNVAGYHVKPGGNAGAITLRNGSASGDILLEIDITTSTTVFTAQLPGNGIRFTDGVYVSLPTSATITIFCG